MISFKRYITENSMNYSEVEKTLYSLGYTTKQVTKSRIAIITDRRSDAINNVLKQFKDSKLLKDRQSLNISSLGIIQLPGSMQIIVKPATKNVLKSEQEATESLIGLIRQAVEQEGKPIDVNIGKFRIKSVVTAGSDQIKGDPKADIALIDDKKKEVGFISHKKEGGAKAFQQYGGISKSSGEMIYQDVLVEMYVRDLSKIVDKNFKSNRASTGFSVWRKIPASPAGRPLIARSVYGPNWNGGRSFNRDSVHCIGQGSPILTRNRDGSYDLTFSESIHTADDISWALAGDYRAIFASTFRAGRTTTHGNISVGDMRSGIYPYDFIKSRRATEI